MKIYLKDQTRSFKSHLDRLKSKKVMTYDKLLLPEKITSVDLNTNKQIDLLDLDFLFGYKIFPRHIMTYYTQWTAENRKIQSGDTIVQQVYLPPVPAFSQKLIFGVRINEIIDRPDKKGFSYETLEGHAEKGVSIFTVEPAGKLIFKIQTYSAPGNPLAKLLGPIFSVPYQAFCTRAALQNVKRQLENQ